MTLIDYKGKWHAGKNCVYHNSSVPQLQQQFLQLLFRQTRFASMGFSTSVLQMCMQ